ncbi:TPA: peptide ABC transporter substrate-binding protein [Staphylococcus aureus]
MTRKLKALILILVATIALSGCANDDGIYSDKGQVFRKILSSDLTSLDTSLITDEISSEVTAQTFEGLYTLGKGDKPVLGVAKAFPEKSKDGKTLKVKLRSDAKWSNGDKVTAQDFVYAWRKTVDPKTGSEFAYIMGDIKNASDISTGKKPVEQLGIKALDDETLQIDLEKPVPYINQLLALNTFAPQNEKVAKKYGKNYGTAADRAVYNGPFKVDDWKQEDKTLLSKNQYYWDKKKVKLDKVNYKVIKDLQAGASLYDTESVDDAVITADQVNKYKDNKGLNFVLTTGTFFVKMNEKQYPDFKNKNLRLAIAQAIDKKGYVDSVKNNGSIPWDKAKKELGKNELSFSMNTEDTPDAKISAEYIKSQVEKNLPGVTLKIKQLPFKQRVSLELSNNFEASLSGWSADYPDPMAYLETMTTGSAQNNTDWGNKEYDQLLKVARTKLALQPNERYENLKKAEEMFLGDAPVAPIYQKGVAHLTNPQVKGLIYHKFGPNNSLKHVYIDKSIDKETGKKKK